MGQQHTTARGADDPMPDLDRTAMGLLLEESQDVHRDAMAATADALDDLADRRDELQLDPDEARAVGDNRRAARRGLTFGGGLLAAAGAAAALDALAAAPAFAASTPDVQILQTAASLEVLAVGTYKTALTLPFIGGSAANPVVKAFAMTTMQQHQEHLAAFNAAVTRLGGTAQTTADPVLSKVVAAAVPGLTGPAPVVALALELEQGAAETYVADTAALGDATAKKLTASVMGVEAQHVAILLAVQALLAANAPQLIALPPDAASLPAAAGSIGFPNAFFPTDMARPATEGAS